MTNIKAQRLLVLFVLQCAIGTAQLFSASNADLRRAATRVPRPEYQGKSFAAMNAVLNKHLQGMPGLTTKSCSDFTVQELQSQILEPIFKLANPDLLTMYTLHNDKRQRRQADLEEVRENWGRMNAHIEKEPNLHDLHRDGLCHEAVMWFVHHLSESRRGELVSQLVLPLLPMHRHNPPAESSSIMPGGAHAEVHEDYESKVSCQQCHSGPVWKSWVNATLPPPLPVDSKHPGRERLRSCDYQNKPPCGPCEGLGGPRWGDSLSAFLPVNCTVVADPKDVPVHERPRPTFPPMGHAFIDGDTRSPLSVRPDPKKPGKYPKVNATISLAWDSTMRRHRYDFQDMPPFGQPATNLFLQTTGQMASKNSSGVMVSIIGQEGKFSLCVCTDAVAGIMHIDSFVPHEEHDPLDLLPEEGGLSYLGRIKLSPVDGGSHSTVVADHYMKWAFHFLVDADPSSKGFGTPLRLYGEQGVRFIYSNWSIVDPRIADPKAMEIPKWCVLTSKTCREMHSEQVQQARGSALQFV